MRYYGFTILILWSFIAVSLAQPYLHSYNGRMSALDTNNMPLQLSAYLDANGDGNIDETDWFTNRHHLGYTHDLYTGAVEGNNTVGTDLTFNGRTNLMFWLLNNRLAPFQDSLFHTSQQILTVIQLGKRSQPLDNVYGIVFEVSYDMAVFEGIPNRDGSYLSIPNWNWGKYTYRTNPGRLHHVQVDTNGQGRSGTWWLGNLHLRIKPSAPVLTDTMQTQICFENFKLIDSTGTEIPIGAQCLTLRTMTEPLSPCYHRHLLHLHCQRLPFTPTHPTAIPPWMLLWTVQLGFTSMSSTAWINWSMNTWNNSPLLDTTSPPSLLLASPQAFDQDQHTLTFAKAQ